MSIPGAATLHRGSSHTWLRPEHPKCAYCGKPTTGLFLYCSTICRQAAEEPECGS